MSTFTILFLLNLAVFVFFSIKRSQTSLSTDAGTAETANCWHIILTALSVPAWLVFITLQGL